MAGRWRERIARGLVVTGAAIMVLSACSRAWWVIRGGSALFMGRSSWIGPVTGTWCTGDSPWCNEEHLEFLGHGVATAGTIVFYAALVTAAATAMLVVATRRYLATVAYTAIAAALTAAIAGVALAAKFQPQGVHEPIARNARGAGLFVLLAGAACVVAGAWLARDVKIGVGFPLLWLACLLGYAGHVLVGDRQRV
jgi:hypothetical protein